MKVGTKFDPKEFLNRAVDPKHYREGMRQVFFDKGRGALVATDGYRLVAAFMTDKGRGALFIGTEPAASCLVKVTKEGIYPDPLFVGKEGGFPRIDRFLDESAHVLWGTMESDSGKGIPRFLAATGIAVQLRMFDGMEGRAWDVLVHREDSKVKPVMFKAKEPSGGYWDSFVAVLMPLLQD